MTSPDIFFRVPEIPKTLSVSRSEIEKAIIETLADLGKKNLAEKGFINNLLEFLDKGMCIYEITRELRVLGYDIGLGEILEIVEILRNNGYLRFIGVKNPNKFERAELIAMIPDFKTVEKTYEEALKEVNMESLKEEVREVLSEAEKKQPVTPIPPSIKYEEIEDKRKEEIRDLARDLSEKLRIILEPQVALSPHIKHIVIATRDGLPIIQVNKKDESPLDEEHVAAAISVVVSQSFQTATNLNKRGFTNVLIKTDKAIIISSYVDSSYVLTIVMDVNTPMGLIYSDFNSVRKIVQPELAKKG